jgi:serine/threonine protein kinase
MTPSAGSDLARGPTRALDALPDAGPADALPPGTQLGNYRLVRCIGEGGMGRVYEAEHALIGRRVAIKVLHPALSSDRHIVTRFFREAKFVNQIRHRNIVDITDFVELPGVATFIVMELLEGQSLRDHVQEHQGPYSPREVADLILPICDALAAAHAVGVVHRDLKPGNIFLCAGKPPAERVKLLDFGVASQAFRPAHLLDNQDATLTVHGMVLGTPAYMSPEQAHGAKIDARSDIYSLGVIMHELACGSPFSLSSTVSDVDVNSSRPPATGSGIVASGPPPALQAIISRCLQPFPDARFATATELADALRQAVASPRPGRALTSQGDPLTPLDRARAHLSRWTRPAVATVMVLAVAAISWWYSARERRDATASQEVTWTVGRAGSPAPGGSPAPTSAAAPPTTTTAASGRDANAPARPSRLPGLPPELSQQTAARQPLPGLPADLARAARPAPAAAPRPPQVRQRAPRGEARRALRPAPRRAPAAAAPASRSAPPTAPAPQLGPGSLINLDRR